MEDCTGDPPVFIDISSDVLLNDLDQDLPNSSQENKEESEENNYLMVAVKRLKCPECRRFATDDADRLTRHIRKVHRGENPFQCFMCDYSTYNKSLFEEHVRIHQGIKPFQCSYCPHRNVSKKNLKKHEKIHRPDNPLKCPHCDHIARHRRGFAYHEKKYHSVKSEKGSNMCKMCLKSFDTEKLLVLHTVNMKKCDELIEGSNEKCDYTACTASLIRAHKEAVHGKVEEKIKHKRDLFECSSCEWSSSNKMKILLHLIHHPEQEVDESVVDLSVLRKNGIMA